MVNLDELKRIKLSHVLDVIKDGGETFFFYFSVNRVRYECSYMKVGTAESLFFFWTNERGQRVGSEIKLKRERSNLGRGEVIYFVCPHSGRKCRTLYNDGYCLNSRYSFESCCYYYQRLSHKERIGETLGVYPYRRYGKTVYKGKITRYGRQLQLYEERERRAFVSFGRYL